LLKAEAQKGGCRSCADAGVPGMVQRAVQVTDTRKRASKAAPPPPMNLPPLAVAQRAPCRRLPAQQGSLHDDADTARRLHCCRLPAAMHTVACTLPAPFSVLPTRSSRLELQGWRYVVCPARILLQHSLPAMQAYFDIEKLDCPAPFLSFWPAGPRSPNGHHHRCACARTPALLTSQTAG